MEPIDFPLKLSSPPIHPFNVPEILSLIASFLLRDKATCDIASCTRVSLSFQAAFTPFLYHSLDLRQFIVDCPPSFQSSLQRHGHLVHTLEANFMQIGGFIPHLTTFAIPNFSNLRILRIFQNPSTPSSSIQYRHPHWQHLVTLLEQNQSLTEVSIQFLSMVIFPLAVWKALANLSLLWTLRIYGAMITNFVEPDQNQRDRMSVVDGFLKACSSAHDLDIDHVSFSSIISTNYAPCFVDPTSLWNSPHLVFKNITSFSFFGRSSHDIAFFSNCLTGASNTLRRLKWSTGHKNHYAPSVMAQRVTQKIVNATKEPKPRGLGMLESLELWDGMPFTDQNIADILDALSSPLKELSVVESGFEDMALAALLRQPHSQKTAQEGVLGAETGSKTEEESTSTLAQPQQTYQTLRPPHCTTLQRLDLTDCPYLTTEMVQQIRDACPNLKELIGM